MSHESVSRKTFLPLPPLPWNKYNSCTDTSPLRHMPPTHARYRINSPLPPIQRSTAFSHSGHDLRIPSKRTGDIFVSRSLRSCPLNFPVRRPNVPFVQLNSHGSASKDSPEME